MGAQIREHWKGNTQQVTRDTRFAWLRGPVDFKLSRGHGSAIAIKIAALVGMMNRRNGATSAARTEHDGVANWMAE